MCMKIFYAIFIVSIVLLTALLIRTFTVQRPVIYLKQCEADDTDFIRANADTVDRFRRALKMETVTYSERNYNEKELEHLIQFIITSYPTIHSSSLVTWERVANYSLLYHIHGVNQHLKPYLLMAHLDVVPADPKEWHWPPFSAELHDDYIYARGTIDDKQNVFGILEALQFFLNQKKIPQRSFYVAFGHDEEGLGSDGAASISRKLQDASVELEFILDEGLFVTIGVVPFIDKPVAMIGISEKGYMTIKISTNVTGGHSSMPLSQSSIGILAAAITRLEENPHQSMLGTGPEVGYFEHIAPEMSFPLQIVLSNIWLFGPLMSRFLSSISSANALIRTTTAVTMFTAGIKENVLAPYAEAIINHRIHPSQTLNEVLEYDRMVIADERVNIEVLSQIDAHPISDYGTESFGFQMIQSTIKQIWGQQGVIVTPSLMVANTDTRHYLKLTKNIYRFSPLVLEPTDLSRFHGINERIAIKNFEETLNFFFHLIINSDSHNLEEKFHKYSHGDL